MWYDDYYNDDGDYCEECQSDIQALEKCGCEKTAVGVVKDRHGGWASASFYKVS